MKTTILTSVFAVLVSITSLNAKNVTTYSNVEMSSSVIKKEYVSLDKSTSTPLTKDVYFYDNKGKLESKNIALWSSEKGWVNAAKYEYQYTDNGKVSNVTYTKWDKGTNSWSDKAEFLAHIYDDNDNILSVEQVLIENNVDACFISQK